MFSSRMLLGVSVALLAVFGSISAAPTTTPEGDVIIVDDGGKSDHKNVLRLGGRPGYLHLDFNHYQGMLLAELIVKKGVRFADATQFIYNSNNGTLRLEDGRMAVAPATLSELEPSLFNMSSIYFASLSEINRSRYTVVRCTLIEGLAHHLECKVPAPEAKRCEANEACVDRSYLQTCPKRRPVYLGHDTGVGCRLEHLVFAKKASKFEVEQTNSETKKPLKTTDAVAKAAAHGAASSSASA